MGYYSTINAFDFQSRLSEPEIKDAYKKFVEGLRDDERDYMKGFYDFEKVSEEGGLYEYELGLDDYHAKHYADRSLAEFTSRVIAPGTHTLIELVGEDGERWGYLVLSNEVHPLTYETLVNGVPLYEFIRAKTGGGEA